MADYTYYAFRLLTGDVITELPLRGGTPSWAVNDPGDLGSPRVDLNGLSPFQRAEVRSATVPWLNGIAVDRDGVIIWSGVITGRRYNSAGQGTYQLACPGLMAYWRRLFVTYNISLDNIDQFLLARGLAGRGQNQIPYAVDSDNSGVLKDLKLAASDLKPVLDVILDLADNVNGFEFALDTAWDTTTNLERVTHRFRLGSPRLGRRSIAGDVLLLEWPGNVENYTWDEDGDEFATEIWGSTQSNEGVTMIRSKENATLLAQGFPRVMGSRSWPGISQAATLDAHIVTALAQSAGYTDAPTFIVSDSGDTSAGFWAVGDDVRLRITDARRFPVSTGGPEPGLDRIVRIQSASLDPVAGKLSLSAFEFTDPVQ